MSLRPHALALAALLAVTASCGDDTSTDEEAAPTTTAEATTTTEEATTTTAEEPTTTEEATTTTTEPSDEPSDDELAQTVCETIDTEGLANAHFTLVEHYRPQFPGDPDGVQQAAAFIEDLATLQYCPEHRDFFEASMMYEDWIAGAG